MTLLAVLWISIMGCTILKGGMYFKSTVSLWEEDIDSSSHLAPSLTS